MNKVTETIFDNGDVVIPMADVSHIEYVKHPIIGANGIQVITKHTRWDMDADTWSNACYISEDKKQAFLKSWCIYRSEFDNVEVQP